MMNKGHPVPTTPHKVLFTQSSMVAIKQETLRHREQGLETGGILVGRKLDNGDFLIVAATGAGPTADHKVHTFAPDPDFANRELKRARSRYNNVDYVGLWHKHPPQMDYPSGGDWQQTQDILQDPDYKVNGELVTPIVVVRGDYVLLKSYYVSTSTPDFVFVEHEIVSNDDPRIAEIEIPERPIDKLYNRLEEERIQLLSISDAFEVQLDLLETEQLAFTLRYAGEPHVEIYLICNTAYPQSPPQVIMSQNGVEVPASAVTLSAWSPSNKLRDIVEELLAPYLKPQLQLRPAPKRRTVDSSTEDSPNAKVAKKTGKVGTKISLAIIIPLIAVSMFCLGSMTAYLFTSQTKSTSTYKSPIATTEITSPITLTTVLTSNTTLSTTMTVTPPQRTEIPNFDIQVNDSETGLTLTLTASVTTSATVGIERAGFWIFVNDHKLEGNQCFIQGKIEDQGSPVIIRSVELKAGLFTTPASTCAQEDIPCLIECYNIENIDSSSLRLSDFKFKAFIILANQDILESENKSIPGQQ